MKFAGMGIAEGRRLKQLEEENRKPNQLVADFRLDRQILQDALKGNLRRLIVGIRSRIDRGRRPPGAGGGCESLTIELDPRLTGAHVAAILDRIGRERGLPENISVDDGSEFTGKLPGQWASVSSPGLQPPRNTCALP